jgi:hypothetical protein
LTVQWLGFLANLQRALQVLLLRPGKDDLALQTFALPVEINFAIEGSYHVVDHARAKALV